MLTLPVEHIEHEESSVLGVLGVLGTPMRLANLEEQTTNIETAPPFGVDACQGQSEPSTPSTPSTNSPHSEKTNSLNRLLVTN
jgi:hypothetical protein